MKKFLANFVSILFIPLFAPTYLFLIIFFYFPQITSKVLIEQKWEYIIGIFIATVLLPFVIVFVLYKLKIISSLSLDKRSDRYIPQIFSAITYGIVCQFFIHRLSYGNYLTLSVLASTFSVMALTVITRYWKISTHATGVFGMLSVITIIYYKYPLTHFGFIYITLIILAISVCYARIYLKVHTLMQILAGTALGIFSGSLILLF